jgi:thiamine kinase-like enzyme
MASGLAPPSGSGVTDVRERLEAVLGCAIDGLESLTDKRGAVSYRALVDGRELFCKLLPSASSRVLDVAAEYELLVQLAAVTIAPEPIAVSVEYGLLVTEYLRDYRTLSRADVSEAIRPLGRLLKRMHSIDAGLPAVDHGAALTTYLADLGDGLTVSDRFRAEEAFELLDAVGTLFGEHATLHLDLVPSNVMAVNLPAGIDLKLVDFEYAAAGPPVLDLAGVAEFSRLSDEAVGQLIEAYFDSSHPPFSMADFAKVRRLTALVSHFWARAEADSDDTASFLLGGSETGMEETE